MRKNILLCLAVGLILAGCGARGVAPVEHDEYTEYDEYVEYAATPDCVGAGATEIRYSMPNGNDLQLETPRSVIQIDARPGVDYAYYVWVGNRDYDADPDLIVQDGVAAVLVSE